MIIYISGPISGVENYAERFRKEELRLTSEGHVALNPATLPVGMGNHEKCGCAEVTRWMPLPELPREV